jgi:hypothetical protein
VIKITLTTQINGHKENKNGIVIDLNNVLLQDKDPEGRAKIQNIKPLEIKLKSLGYQTVINISGPGLRRKIDSEEGYEKLISEGIIHQAPANSDTDWYILEFAKTNGYDIISNDCFKQYRDEFGKSWIEEHRKALMLIKGQLIIQP